MTRAASEAMEVGPKYAGRLTLDDRIVDACAIVARLE